MIKRKEEFSLRELINIFVPKLWIIIIVSFALGLCSALYTAVIKDDTYTSTTNIHITKDVTDFDESDLKFANSYLQTYVKVLTQPVFLNQVLNDFSARNKDKEYYTTNGWDKITSSQIKGYISSSTELDILSVSVTTPDAHLSYELATSISNVIDNDSYPILAYDDEVKTRILAEAELPKSPDSPRIILYAFIGVVIGAVLSMIVIFILDLLDVVIHDKKKIEDNFDIPVLGVIPRYISEENGDKK